MRHSRCNVSWILLPMLVWGIAASVGAESDVAAGPAEGRLERELVAERAARERLEGEVQELRSTVDELRAVLRELGTRVAEEARRAPAPGRSPSLDDWASALAGTRHALATPEDLRSRPLRVGAVAGGDAERPADPVRIVLSQTLISEGGLLLPPGVLEVEPSMDYAFFDTRRINVSGFSILPTLIVGVLETEKVQTNFLDALATLRLGLPWRTQAEVRIPYRYVHQRTSTEVMDDTESDVGFGDLELGLSYQPVRERGWVPDVILGVRGRLRTGDDIFDERPGSNPLPLGGGFNSVQGSVTAVKSFDPGVLFAGLRFEHVFDRDVKLFSTDPAETEIDPGYLIGYNLGLALSISPELAFSFRADQRFVTKTYFDGPGTGFRRE
ncbi:MAG: hypothetical protein R3266_13405, partial [Gemmatimonadota bacterium]|nr:hypothetical protein [Gemmatimonadota bacterium]